MVESKVRLGHKTFGDPTSLIGYKNQVVWVAMVSGAESTFSNADWLNLYETFMNEPHSGWLSW